MEDQNIVSKFGAIVLVVVVLGEGGTRGWVDGGKRGEEKREEMQGGVDKNQRVHRSALFCLLTYLLLLYSFDLMMMSSGDVWDLIRVRNHPSII